MAGERWPGLTSLVMVESIRQLGEKESIEGRYYLSSLPGRTDAAAERLNRVIRTHWEIESAPQAHRKEARYELTNCA